MTVDEYIKSLESIRKDSRERLHQSAIRWNEWANNRASELSEHLFTIASIVLPLSVLPLTQAGFTTGIGNNGKIALIVAWGLFILSLISGLVHILIEAKFFERWAEQEGNRSAVFKESILTNSPTDAFNRLEAMNQASSSLATMPNTHSPKFLYLQGTFLILGIFMIGIMLTIKLFSTQPECNTNQQSVQNKQNPHHRLFYKHKFLKMYQEVSSTNCNE